MTTLTTVLGLLPLVLFPGAGSELYRGLGAVLLGGLLVSTVVTLVLVPVLLGLCLETLGIEGRTAAESAADGNASHEPWPHVAPPAVAAAGIDRPAALVVEVGAFAGGGPPALQSSNLGSDAS
jgi:hypothetical protein